MYSENYEWGLKECVKRAYGDTKERNKGYNHNNRSLYFHTKFVNLKKAIELIDLIPRYNYFNPKYVKRHLKNLDPDKTKISIGREGSVCLYIYTKQPNKVCEELKKLNKYIAKGDELPPSFPNEFGIVNNFPTHGTFKDRKLSDAKKDEWVILRCWWD